MASFGDSDIFFRMETIIMMRVIVVILDIMANKLAKLSVYSGFLVTHTFINYLCVIAQQKSTLIKYIDYTI